MKITPPASSVEKQTGTNPGFRFEKTRENQTSIGELNGKDWRTAMLRSFIASFVGKIETLDELAGVYNRPEVLILIGGCLFGRPINLLLDWAYLLHFIFFHIFSFLYT